MKTRNVLFIICAIVALAVATHIVSTRLHEPEPNIPAEGRVLSQLETSPEFAKLAEACSKNIPCEDDVQINFVRQIATVGDAARAYELATKNCEFRELREVISLKTDLLIPRAWGQTRSFDERIALLQLAEHSSYVSYICYNLADEARTPTQFATLLKGGRELCDDRDWHSDAHPWVEYVGDRFHTFGVDGVRSFTTLAELLEFAGTYQGMRLNDDCAESEFVNKLRVLAPQVSGHDSLAKLASAWYTASDITDGYLHREERRWVNKEVGEVFALHGLFLLHEAAGGGTVARMASGTYLEPVARERWAKLAQAEIDTAVGARDLTSLRKLRNSDKVPPEKHAELETKIAMLYGVVPVER